MPDDILRGATGVPVIDAAVRALYETGYLHNHARLWLASYVVHLRKVNWRAGAVWSYGYLLDGDLAPNHLSWQWVAGTLTGRPYLFNANNVSRNAGQVPGWRSPDTAIDCGYDEIERIARSCEVLPAEPGTHPGVTPPGLFAAPPAGLLPQADLPSLAGRRVRLVHPWSLAAPGDADPAHRRAVGAVPPPLSVVGDALALRAGAHAPRHATPCCSANRPNSMRCWPPRNAWHSRRATPAMPNGWHGACRRARRCRASSTIRRSTAPRSRASGSALRRIRRCSSGVPRQRAAVHRRVVPICQGQA